MHIHASCVEIEKRGVLLAGPSGVGKSDVALRLMDGGATLVSDDQTFLKVEGGRLLASPPEKIAGLIEVRSVGLLRFSYSAEVEISLYVELVEDPALLERLPELSFYSLLDRRVRFLKLLGKAASTPAAIRAFLKGTYQDV
ncbi:MAG TPA: serine/threonine protein kinase [Rhodospirillaceae bacterium]|nr:serine/threonine protein kinase [Rhodospirillaceae bacterium]